MFPPVPAALRRQPAFCSTSAAARPISSSARWSNSVSDSSTWALTRSTSARRSLRVSSRNGARACSCSQFVASRDATAGISAGGSARRSCQARRGPGDGARHVGDLHGKEPLVYDLPEPIDDTRAVEIDARRALMLERVERRAPGRERPGPAGACAVGSPRTADGLG